MHRPPGDPRPTPDPGVPRTPHSARAWTPHLAPATATTAAAAVPAATALQPLSPPPDSSPARGAAPPPQTDLPPIFSRELANGTTPVPAAPAHSSSSLPSPASAMWHLIYGQKLVPPTIHWESRPSRSNQSAVGAWLISRGVACLAFELAAWAKQADNPVKSLWALREAKQVKLLARARHGGAGLSPQLLGGLRLRQ